MGILVVFLLVLSAILLLLSRRTTETILIAFLDLSLAEFWYIMLIYIAKKRRLWKRNADVAFRFQKHSRLFAIFDIYLGSAWIRDGNWQVSVSTFPDVACFLL